MKNEEKENNEKQNRVEGEMQDRRSISAQTSTIHGCAQSGDLNGLQKLLRDNPSLINERYPVTAETPLHISAVYNRRDIVEFLLDCQESEKVELEAKNMHGETPLHMAAANGCTDIARLLINHGALVEAKAKTGRTPLHQAVIYSARTEDCSIVETLLELSADCGAEDNEEKTPLDYLPAGPASEQLRKLLVRRLEEQRKERAIQTCSKSKTIMDELEKELSTIVGLDELKSQLRNWAKGMVFDEMRRATGLKVGARRLPHMVFLGNPGTGKTTMARILGKLLDKMGISSTDEVTEVQLTDLVGKHMGKTGLKARKKDEGRWGFKPEVLEETTAVVDSGSDVVISAEDIEAMKAVISSNEGFNQRVTKFFHFDDLTSKELAKILFIKMNDQGRDSELYGFKLHETCNEDSLAELIYRETTEKQRREMNGDLIIAVLANARENLDRRLAFNSTDTDELRTITLEDLEEGLRLLVL